MKNWFLLLTLCLAWPISSYAQYKPRAGGGLPADGKIHLLNGDNPETDFAIEFSGTDMGFSGKGPGIYSPRIFSPSISNAKINGGSGNSFALDSSSFTYCTISNSYVSTSQFGDCDIYNSAISISTLNDVQISVSNLIECRIEDPLLIIRNSQVLADDNGLSGEMKFDDGYIYRCFGNGDWRRAQISYSTW